MESEPYSDQLLSALRELRKRVNEIRGEYDGQIPPESQAELIQMRTHAREIGSAWSASRIPPPPDKPTLPKVAERNRMADEVHVQNLELARVLLNIEDFSVEAIDNAIRVVESQA